MPRDFPNSTGSYLSGGDLDVSGSAFSISAWVRMDSYPGDGDGYIVTNGPAHWALGWFRNIPQFWTGGVAIASASTASTGVWFHIAGTQVGTGASDKKIYLNNSVVVTGTGTANGTTGTAVRVGYFGTYGFDGQIAHVGVWNAGLSADEVAALYRGVSPGRIRPNSLKGHWPLYGVAYPEPDLSGNGFSLTQTGTVNAYTTSQPGVGRPRGVS